MSQKYRILFFLSLILFFFFSCSPLEYQYVFENKEIIPSKVIFNQSLYEKRGELFLLLQNRQSVNYKLVRFNQKKENIVETIYEVKNNRGRIIDCKISNSHLLFSVLEVEDKKAVQKIFIMKLGDKNSFQLIFQKDREYDHVYPLHPCLVKGGLLWIDHDAKMRMSFICYHLFGQEDTKFLAQYPFRSEGFELPFFFLASDGQVLYHDLKGKEGSQIIVRNISEGKTVNHFLIGKDIQIHYCGVVNQENHYLALYAKSNRSDLIYAIDLITGKEDRLVAFDSDSVIYKDSLQTVGNELAYPIQKGISEYQKPLIYIEFYNRETYMMEQVKDAFDVVISLKYRVYLKKVKNNQAIKQNIDKGIVEEPSQRILQIFKK